MIARAAAALAAAGLAACAAVPPAAPVDSGASLSGRLAVRVAATATTEPHSVSAVFDLAGSAREGRLDLSTPLGSLMGRATWTPQRVALVTPQGETVFPDLDALTREVLGETVPVAAMFDWLRGQPWPAATSQPRDDGAPGFRQLGWSVGLARFDEALITAVRDRPPAVTVQVKLDRP